MKKLLKTLAATAVLASVIPTKWNKTEDGGTLEAMLWKATWTPKENAPGSTEVNINFGFHNPFPKKKNEEEDFFADELIVDYTHDSNTIVYSSDDADFMYEDKNLTVDESVCEEEVSSTQTPAAETTDTKDTQGKDDCGKDSTCTEQ
ncbi:MAG: hypothetical protein IJ955_00930 [Oscillospiraceae bacterium]|nr:hypothetical protein [Oscillospiraceae bacterium]